MRRRFSLFQVQRTLHDLTPMIPPSISSSPELWVTLLPDLSLMIVTEDIRVTNRAPGNGPAGEERVPRTPAQPLTTFGYWSDSRILLTCFSAPDALNQTRSESR